MSDARRHDEEAVSGLLPVERIRVVRFWPGWNEDITRGAPLRQNELCLESGGFQSDCIGRHPLIGALCERLALRERASCNETSECVCVCVCAGRSNWCAVVSLE